MSGTAVGPPTPVAVAGSVDAPPDRSVQTPAGGAGEGAQPPADSRPDGPAGDIPSAAPVAVPRRRRTREPWIYLAAFLLSSVLATVMMKLWRAIWSSPFYLSGDAVSSAAHFRTTILTGWYEYQPNLGAPYGQHYHDYPFADDLHPAVAKLFGLFTSNWALAFNLYYVLGFPLAALTAVYFLRKCGLSPAMTVVLAALYSVAPYHFYRNEMHMFLSEYFPVPLALAVVLAVARGQRVWGRRAGVGRIRSVLTGRGAGTVVIMVLIVYDGAYYALFTMLLLAAAALFAVLRDRNARTFFGAVGAGAVAAFSFVLAMVPDLVYSATNGKDLGAVVRYPQDTEWYQLKFAQLVLPAPGHPIPAFNELRNWYDRTFPVISEEPALGLIAALGFVLVLGVGAVLLTGRTPRRPLTPRQQHRRETLRSLSLLTWTAFAISTVGGLGTLISFLSDSIRGWNRMSIFIALFALAGLGLLLEAGVERLAGRWRRTVGSGNRPTERFVRRVWIPVVAAIVLVVGAADQSLTTAVPNYAAVAAGYQSDGVFVQQLQDKVPAGSMMFQLPYMAWPESLPMNGIAENEQLRLYLHSTTLRWSGGGIKGRPQTNWPATVSAEDAEQMTKDLVMIGFTGIVIDRAPTGDNGAAAEAQLFPYLGAPSLTSPDGRYAYLSLAPVRAKVELTTTAAQRAAAAEAITHITP